MTNPDDGIDEALEEFDHVHRGPRISDFGEDFDELVDARLEQEPGMAEVVQSVDNCAMCFGAEACEPRQQYFLPEKYDHVTPTRREKNVVGMVSQWLVVPDSGVRRHR